jgi:EF-P beta-lysylation protein EpmB
MNESNWRQKSRNHCQADDFQDMKSYQKQSEDLFKLQVPEFYKKNIDFKNHRDPLLLQIMPTEYELLDSDDENEDPVGDLNASPVEGLIHKYHGRVLLIATGTCAINCRYCFRRNFPYAQNHATKHNWKNAINYIKQHSEIHEVILSGGDPLMLSTNALKKLTDQLKIIPHIKTLRIHTRLPLVSPSRITNNFLNWLKNLPFKKVIVLHCNHSNELSSDIKKICNDIRLTDTILLNQSVLLKNINNDFQVLADLSHRLFECGILPYYLNQLDKAKGTSHFRVSDKDAKIIHKLLLENLSGYLVPKLVIEISGKKNKTPLN